MLNQIRYHQQYRQIQAQIEPGAGSVVSYDTRDPATGLRVVTTADGGTQNTQYLSNSQPTDVLALSRSNSIGLAGYASQKPY
jgi:ssRNA-specific RNase YbeY (16S rRNA maturation enzyme)